MKTILLILALTGCNLLPHVDPQVRTWDTAGRAAVRVYSSCSEPSPFKTGEPDDPHIFDPDIDWYPPGAALGVIISERHVLTAAHVVRCPTIPAVTVYLEDGRWFAMDVDKDDAMFGEGRDIARLVIASADHFHTGIAPPRLGHATVDDPAMGALYKHMAYGEFDGSDQLTLKTRPGDSGAGIYNLGGELVGVVHGGDGAYTTDYTPVEPRFLEGT